ncbi:MAG: ABC transporter substrate-binding protein [Chloroflexi bacterium]|nr:ABC transporter substrate-binding protein [Chloroflexota bacterium]
MLKKFMSSLLLISTLIVAVGCAPAALPAQPQASSGGAAAAPSGEVVTLDYYWIGNGDTDQRPAVEAAVNEYVEPLIGAKVVFHIVGWGDWATKAITGLQAGEKMDIFFTADWQNYMQLVSQDLLIPLNDNNGKYGNLLEKYGPDILKGLNPAFITGTQIDGINYAVPTNKELTVPEGFIYNVTLAEEIGFTEAEAAKIKSLRDLEPWLEKAKAARPDEYPYLTDGSGGFQPWVPGFAAGISSNLISMKYDPDASGKFDERITSIMETDWATEHTAIMREWYTKGWIHPDAGLTTFNTGDLRNAGKFFIESQPLKGSNIKAQELVNASGNPDLVLKEIYSQSKVNITTHSGGSMLAIPVVSEHPVEAMKFINLMHSDSKLLNIMLFGVEGTHWKFDPDGRVNILNSAWYGAHGGAWTLGNTMLQAVSNKEDPDKNRKLIEYSNDAVDHPSLGFRFRTEPVAAELTAITAVADGMHRALMTGYVDPKVELPKYIEALKAAGLDKIKGEVEKQYGEWKTKQGK